MDASLDAARPRAGGLPGASALSRLSASGQDNLAAYLFLLPWFIGMVAITIGPILASLALVLNQGMRLLPIFRAIFYLPSLLGTSVAVAILWYYMFGKDGLINLALLRPLGIQGTSYVGDPSFALYTLVVLNLWAFGAGMIIFLAGLRQIPIELYEAAELDGASRWARFWRITLPLLTPVLFFNAVLGLVGGFQAFTSAFVISGGTGGPADATLLYQVYLYQRGFVNLNMGYACAMAWVLLTVIAVCTGVLFWSQKFWVFYGEDR